VIEMALIRWRNSGVDWPLSSMISLFNDPLFSEAESDCALVPATDIRETEQAIVLTAELPGLSGEDVKVSVENNVLTISGEKKNESESEQDGCRCSERVYGRFERSFVLSDNVDQAKIAAEVRNGVLSVTLPKSEQAKPHSIEVKVN